VFHGGARVDFNEPDVKIGVDHEIVTEHLMSVLSVHHHVSCRHDTANDAHLYLRLHLLSVGVLSKCLCEVSLELSPMPHVPFDG